MSRFAKKNIANYQPYQPGKQPQFDNRLKSIKLNTNENPFGVTTKFLEDFAQEMGFQISSKKTTGIWRQIEQLWDWLKIKLSNQTSLQTSLNRTQKKPKQIEQQLRIYPDPTQEALRKIASRVLKVKFDEIRFGNGSDELIGAIFRSFAHAKDSIGIPELTYGAYQTYANLYGNKVISYPMKGIKIDLFSSPNQIAKSKIFFLANPNSPTGQSIPKKDIIRALKKYKETLFIIDEAYIDFSSHASLKSEISKYDNILILRTLSKSASLAGARIGYCLGCKALIDTIAKTLDPYNLNILGQKLALTTFRNYNELAMRCKKTIKLREHLIDELSKRGFLSLNSETNFIYTSPPTFYHPSSHKLLKQPERKSQNPLESKNAMDWHEYFENNQIFTRFIHSKKTISERYLRITVGTAEQNRYLLAAIDKRPNSSMRSK